MADRDEVERITRLLRFKVKRTSGEVVGEAADLIDALFARLAKAERERDEIREWADRLAETLMAVNAQHGGRNAARLLKDYRDYRAAIRKDDNG